MNKAIVCGGCERDSDWGAGFDPHTSSIHSLQLMSSFHTSVEGDESDTGALCVLFPSHRPLTTAALLLCE